MQSRSPSNFRGTDISNYQPGVNYAAVKNAGIKVVYIKLAEGEHTPDALAAKHSDGVDGVGLHKGFYHYFHPSQSAVSQADYFAGLLKSYKYDCYPSVDVEDTEGLNAQQISAAVDAFIREVKAKTGVECLVYSYLYFINTYFTSLLGAYKLWVAHYGVSNPGESAVWKEWTGFQYADKDPVSGGLSDEFTAGVLLSSQQVPSGPPSSVWTKDVYPVPSLPYPANAKTGTAFDVRNADGTAVTGHEVYSGDNLIILSVDYDRQLAEVLYPATTQWIHGYIRNLQSLIHDYWHYQWRNGSTVETVYDASGRAVGSISPGEKATPLYRKNGKLALLYDTAKGMETKFGFVAYDGGFHKF